MPLLVNIKVGSLPGTSGLDSTMVWPLAAKKSKKVLRISATVKAGWLMVGKCRKCSSGKRMGEKAESWQHWANNRRPQPQHQNAKAPQAALCQRISRSELPFLQQLVGGQRIVAFKRLVNPGVGG